MTRPSPAWERIILRGFSSERLSDLEAGYYMTVQPRKKKKTDREWCLAHEARLTWLGIDAITKGQIMS